MAYPEDFDDIVLESLQDLLAHSESTQVALCLHRFEAEVNNGGFHQFFSNSSGQLVPQTIHALGVIGATQTQDLLQRAVRAAFPRGYPSDVADIESSLADYDDVEDALEPLDAEFFEYRDPLSDLVNEYLGGEA